MNKFVWISQGLSGVSPASGRVVLALKMVSSQQPLIKYEQMVYNDTYFYHFDYSVNTTNALISNLAIAPMIDWTHTHFRVFMRMLAPSALLYTDMQTPGAIFNNPQKALSFNDMEHPLALQLGGSSVDELVECAKLAEQRGFNEINLNLGCPSDRVQAGRFGACMMKEPKLVSDCISHMKKAVSIPVTAKLRLGIDKLDDFEFFSSFALQLVDAGADKLIVHARKAWLKGLNPKQNRTIPPINYDFVYQIKKMVNVPVVINGNITSIEEIVQHLELVDGVMLGRLACQNPYEIASIHHDLTQGSTLKSRTDLLKQYASYMTEQYSKGVPISLLIKPVIGLAHGLPGAKHWKESLLTLQRTKQLDGLSNVIGELEAKENIIGAVAAE
jgi:tRNA-dihydrouridine synthase A